MAETILFPEQEVVFNALFADLFPAAILPQAFTLEIGQKYTVKWGDDVYEDLSVFDVGSDLPGYVAIGNGSGFGFPGNGEPFAILYTTESGGLVQIISLSDATSQVVAVYQVEDGAEEDETPSGADIVLRDRNGKQITYHGINYINLKTRDGGTQGFAAYDPETLVPGNLANGVVVGDIKGSMSVPQAVEITVSPDFSAGNMEVVPDNGKVFSKVGILKPANLFPENIAKDVDIAGVVGTLESGGGANTAVIFVKGNSYVVRGRSVGTAQTTVSNSVTLTLPPDSIVLGFIGHGLIVYKVSSSDVFTGSGKLYPVTPTITKTDTAVTIRFLCSTTAYYYVLYTIIGQVSFSIPGISRVDRDGALTLIADSTVTVFPQDSYMADYMVNPVSVVDLSASNIANLTQYELYQWEVAEIKLPATLTSIGTYSLACSATVIDMSLCTAVPILSNANAINQNEGLQIKVPAALYDEWVAATNWSTFANYIVAV